MANDPNVSFLISSLVNASIAAAEASYQLENRIKLDLRPSDIERFRNQLDRAIETERSTRAQLSDIRDAELREKYSGYGRGVWHLLPAEKRLSSVVWC